MDRNGTAADVRYCESPGTCVFHILNAFDLPDGRVAVDAVSYPIMFVNDLTGSTDAKGRLDLFILDPAAGTTSVQRDSHDILLRDLARPAVTRGRKTALRPPGF